MEKLIGKPAILLLLVIFPADELAPEEAFGRRAR
jgi:hypothetical protein